jgi:hypothetical protein
LRRHVSRMLGLLALAALAVGLLASTAAAKPHYTKAQKAKIRAGLLHAAKHNPKVVFSKGFIKKASIVNFTLPATIRLLPAKDQFNHFVSNDDPKLGNNANLDLGPSLGTRTVGLGGKLRAEIQFNDAFDGGHLGDVKLNIPTTGSAVTSTSVPLLANPNTTAQTAPENELFKAVISTAAPNFTITDGTDTTPTLNATSGTLAQDVKTAVGAFTSTGSTDNISVIAVPGPAPNTVAVVIQYTGAKSGVNTPDLTATGAGVGASLNPVQGGPGTFDADGNGGCGGFAGDGTANDVDLLTKLSNSTDPGSENRLGQGPYMSATDGLQDTVLRTGPLTLAVDTPGVSVALPGSTQTHVVGANGGRANLFGSPVNGTGDAVDVTVNLVTTINSLARQVDGAFPTPSGGGGTAEKNGNVAAYFNCRQAWTGGVVNHLEGVKLRGSLHISPAITSDGRLRIAKVSLSTPPSQAAKVAVAACLVPYDLYAAGFPSLGDPQAPLAPSLPAGLASQFNPLFGAFTDASVPAPGVGCNASGGPMDREPFNVHTIGVGTTVNQWLTDGAAVAVSGDLSVTKLRAEVLIGNL